MSTITGADLLAMFGVAETAVPAPFWSLLAQSQMGWRETTRAEVEQYVLDVLRRTDIQRDSRDSERNRAAFETGWQENLQAAQSTGVSPETLKPRYFRPAHFLRYQRGIVVPADEHLEHRAFALARWLIFGKYLRDVSRIYEFGCGSCSNLLMLAELFPTARLWGCDWAPASLALAELVAKEKGIALGASLFNFLEPDPAFRLEPGSAVLTVHALEQIGDRHGAWLEYLLAQSPALVVHYEPILELYDPANLYDYLALQYSRRRGYLTGYLDALRVLEQQGRIRLIEVRRPCLGGVVHEAALVVWQPLHPAPGGRR